MTDATKTRVASACDYASIAVEMNDGAMGTIVLSHAPYLRKGVAPELELHGEDASLSIDRISGAVRIFRTDTEPEMLATLPDEGLGNRFKQYAFPGLRDRIAGRPSLHPDLEDGYQAQLFTDSAAQSAERGAWVDLAEVESLIQ